MPELPEVETTTKDLGVLITGLTIKDVWTNYNSPHYYGKDQIKDPAFFKKFKRSICGTKILSTSRRAKNVLIHLDNKKTILVHMKMTGHLLYGTYKKEKGVWYPEDTASPLADPFNGWIRLVITFTNSKHLALSDMRKFAKVTLVDSDTLHASEDLKSLGPEVLEQNFKSFKERLNKKPEGKIKTVLMNQELLAGIGNIYSDEALWLSHIHPETKVKTINDPELKTLFSNVKKVLKKGINFKGDSTSDYRRPNGEPGDFQHHHKVYRQTKKQCQRKGCSGSIERRVVGGRSAHFCPICQKQ